MKYCDNVFLRSHSSRAGVAGVLAQLPGLDADGLRRVGQEVMELLAARSKRAEL